MLSIKRRKFYYCCINALSIKHEYSKEYKESDEFKLAIKVIHSLDKYIEICHPEVDRYYHKNIKEWKETVINDNNDIPAKFINLVVYLYRYNPYIKTGNVKKNHDYILFVIDIMNEIFNTSYLSDDTYLDKPFDIICPKCGVTAEYIDDKEIYGKTKFGMRYRCPVCEAHVGVYKGTSVPLGTLADKELQEYRKKVHYFFDSMWQKKNWSRTKAYAWLSKQLNLPKEKTHIAMFDLVTCKKAINVIINS